MKALAVYLGKPHSMHLEDMPNYRSVFMHVEAPHLPADGKLKKTG